LWLLCGLAIVVLTLIVLFYKEFLIISFDPVLALTLKLKTERLQLLMFVLLALTIVVSLQTVGVGLVAGMLVTPGAAAYLLARRLPKMMLIAAAIGVVSSVVGTYASFWFEVASGAAIVLTATVIFLMAFLFAPGRGLVWQRAAGRKARRG
jgi:ABC-type Mn2+/Zn2+ transport system permease subunit